MVNCAVPGCHSNSANSRLRFFQFPKDSRRNELWKAFTKRGNMLPNYPKLCEVHFAPSQFEQNRQDGWCKLKWSAVPTLHPPFDQKRSKKKCVQECFTERKPDTSLKLTNGEEFHNGASETSTDSSANMVAGKHLGNQQESEPKSPSTNLCTFSARRVSGTHMVRDKKVLQNLLRTIAENIQRTSFQLQETTSRKCQLMQMVNALMQEEIALQGRLKKESDKENVVKQQLQEIENEEKDLWKEEEPSCEELDTLMQQNERRDMRTECWKVEEPCCKELNALTEKDGHHGLQVAAQEENDLVSKNIHTDTSTAKQMDLKLFSGFVAIPIINSVQIVTLKLCSDENMTKCSDSSPGLLKDSTNLTNTSETAKAENQTMFTEPLAEKTNEVECNSSDQSTHLLCSVDTDSLGPPPMPQPRIYICIFCGEHFRDARARQSHELTTHGTEFRCSVCDKVFLYRDYLASHKKKVHTDEKHDDQTMFADCLDEKMNLNECNSSASDQSTRPLCSVEKDSFGPSPMPQPHIYICIFCGEHFRDARARQSHELTMHGTEFRCNVCDKVFSCREYLVSHKKMHTDEKPFACTLCDRHFRTNRLMKRHFRHHTGEKLYACSVCSERFLNADKRRVHMSVHTGKQPYWCQNCRRGFSSNGCLTRHLRIHRGEKQFECDVCGKRFRNRYQIIAHKETHGEKPYVCYCCGKRLGASSYRAHMKTHSGIKVYYQCTVCDKKLSKKTTLEMHTRIVHMGEAPYICDICYKGFTKNKDCKLHKKEHEHCSS